MSSKHNVCWTLNNYTAEELQKINDVNKHIELNLRYLLYVKQIGEKGTPHLQGFAQFYHSGGPKRIQKLMGKNKKDQNRIWNKRADGTAKQAIDYIIENKKGTNQDLPVSFGEPCFGQGQRSELVLVHKAIEEGKTEQDIGINFPTQYLKYHSGIGKLIKLHKKPKILTRSQPLELHITIGPAGIGKSHDTIELLLGKTVAIIDNLSLKHNNWENYDGEDIVFIDDFDSNNIQPTTFFNLVDGITKNVNKKYSNFKFVATKIYITCPDHPIFWWKHWMAESPNNWEQLARRITTLVKKDFKFVAGTLIDIYDKIHHIKL